LIQNHQIDLLNYVLGSTTFLTAINISHFSGWLPSTWA